MQPALIPGHSGKWNKSRIRKAWETSRDMLRLILGSLIHFPHQRDEEEGGEGQCAFHGDFREGCDDEDDCGEGEGGRETTVGDPACQSLIRSGTREIRVGGHRDEGRAFLFMTCTVSKHPNAHSNN